jgi:hypothetical protein
MITVTDQSTSMTVMGRQRDAHQVITTGTRSEVDDPAGDGTRRMRTTTEFVRMEVDAPTGHLVYDSSDPLSEMPQAAEPYAFLVGRTITSTVSADGITKLDNLDSLMYDLVGHMTMPPGVSTEDVQKTMKEQYGDGFFAEITQRGVSALPDHPISVGESWTHSTTIGGPMPMTIAMTWTLQARRNGVAVIDVRSETVVDSTTVHMGRMSVRRMIKAAGTGTLEIDEATGWTLRSKMVDEMSGTTIMEGGRMGRMETPMTVHTITTMEPAGNG